MDTDKESPPKGVGSEFDRFQSLTRRLLRVPKREMQDQEKPTGRKDRAKKKG